MILPHEDDATRRLELLRHLAEADRWRSEAGASRGGQLDGGLVEESVGRDAAASDAPGAELNRIPAQNGHPAQNESVAESAALSDSSADDPAELLAEIERDELNDALETLLAVYLGAVLGADSFASWRLPPEAAHAAWSRIERARPDRSDLPTVPAPGEAPIGVARRALRALARLWAPTTAALPMPGQDAVRSSSARRCIDTSRAAAADESIDGETDWEHARVGPWPLRLHWAQGGAAAAFERWNSERGSLECGGSSLADGAWGVDGLVDAVEALFDLGRVARARVVIEEHADLAAAEPRLARLLGFALALAGQDEAAHELLASPALDPRPLPLALARLAAQEARFARALAARPTDLRAPAEDSCGARGAGASGTGVDRSAGDLWFAAEAGAQDPLEFVHALRARVGAVCVDVVALGPAGSSRSLAHSVAPALEEGWAEFQASVDAACRDPRRPEYDLVAAARPIRAHADPGSHLAACVARARALVLVPCLADDGEVCGWLRLEFEHHLIPRERDLEACAQQLATRVRQAAEAFQRGARLAADSATLADPPATSRTAEESRAPAVTLERDTVPPPFSVIDDALDPLGAAGAALVAKLPLKFGRRRWYAIDVVDGSYRIAASGGPALGNWLEQPGGGRALRRAQTTDASLRFDAPDPVVDGVNPLAIAAAAHSGLSVPMRSGGAIVGFVCIESERRADFSSADQQRIEAALEGAGESWHLARFRSWHRNQFGEDVLPEIAWSRPLSDLIASARARAVPALVGPRGAGHSVLARWLHFLRFESSASGRLPEFIELDGAQRDLALPDQPVRGTLFVARADSLNPELSRALVLRAHAAEAAVADDAPVFPAERIVLGFETSPDADPGLDSGLRALATKLVLELPALEHRRRHLEPLIELLAQRAARAEGTSDVALNLEARALLWRQPWKRNLRQLSDFVYQLVLLEGADHADRNAPTESSDSAQEIDASAVQRAAARVSLRLAKRLPSRHPPRELLVCALDATRCETGRVNKTRAALFLGWDKSTLQSRLNEKLPDLH